MCLWQFMLKNLRWVKAARSSASVVLPQPVSPTSRTGSLLLSALMVRAAILLKLSFICTYMFVLAIFYSLNYASTTRKYSVLIFGRQLETFASKTFSKNLFSSSLRSFSANMAYPSMEKLYLLTNFLSHHFSRFLIVTSPSF